MTLSETENDRPLVRFEHIEKSYDGETLVVKDLNLDIARGEFVTMLGPSGSGKTTCLMMLSGFETPTNGEIYLDDQPIGSIPPHKRNIGFCFQNYVYSCAQIRLYEFILYKQLVILLLPIPWSTVAYPGRVIWRFVRHAGFPGGSVLTR